MLTSVWVQGLVVLLSALLAWPFGTSNAVSASLGGLTVALPAALLAVRMSVSSNKVFPVLLLLGEFLKIGLTVLLMFLVVRFWPALNWPGFIWGVTLATLAPFLVLMVLNTRRRKAERHKIEQLLQMSRPLQAGASGDDNERA